MAQVSVLHTYYGAGFCIAYRLWCGFSVLHTYYGAGFLYCIQIIMRVFCIVHILWCRFSVLRTYYDAGFLYCVYIYVMTQFSVLRIYVIVWVFPFLPVFPLSALSAHVYPHTSWVSVWNQ